MAKNENYISTMNASLFRELGDSLKITAKNPSLALFISKMIKYQKKAEKIREENEKNGLHVPSYIIASITNRCNLHCKGCYAIAHKRKLEQEMPANRWEELFNEAKQLGVSVIMLAGGEPFVRSEIIESAAKQKEIIFPVFTNGTLINDDNVNMLKRYKNIVPVLSIEGFESDTDSRRGFGVFESVKGVIDKIKNEDIFFGVSITVTSKNYDTVTDKSFISKLIQSGCRLFFFVEYVPVEEGTDELILENSERVRLGKQMEEFQAEYPGIFIAFPGDEEKFGGCLAAGRGFIHVSPSGRIEPCPFAPYSDKNIEEMSLKDALSSKLLEQIRQNHDKLTETKGGCALWTNKEWVQSIMDDAE